MPSLPRLVGSSAFWLAVVCALFLAAQLVLFDLERPLDWDEAVYLSETYAGVEPVGYSAHRSRGIILLVAPIAVLGPPVWLVRLFLAPVSYTHLTLPTIY